MNTTLRQLRAYIAHHLSLSTDDESGQDTNECNCSLAQAILTSDFVKLPDCQTGPRVMVLHSKSVVGIIIDVLSLNESDGLDRIRPNVEHGQCFTYISPVSVTSSEMDSNFAIVSVAPPLGMVAKIARVRIQTCLITAAVKITNPFEISSSIPSDLDFPCCRGIKLSVQPPSPRNILKAGFLFKSIPTSPNMATMISTMCSGVDLRNDGRHGHPCQLQTLAVSGTIHNYPLKPAPHLRSIC